MARAFYVTARKQRVMIVSTFIKKTENTLARVYRSSSNRTPHADSSAAVPARPVRFLFAVNVPDDCKLLMALGCGGGDPNLRELEPHCRLAQTVGQVSAGGERGRMLFGLPAHSKCGGLS